MRMRGVTLLLCCALTACALTAVSPAPPTTIRLPALLARIEAARTVTVSAYTLQSRSPILHALAIAHARGAHVALVLTGSGMGYAVAENRRIEHSDTIFHVVLLARPIHLKSVVLDHGTNGVYLSDRNFARYGIILRLPAQDALPVERAVMGDPHDAGALTVTKGSSLAAEARLIDRARHSVRLSTESFGDGNAVYDALRRALARRVHVTITVARSELRRNRYEQRALARLRRAGARVNTSWTDEKLLLVDRRIGWLGSTNATYGYDDQIDWGYTTTAPALLATIARHLALPHARRL